MSKRKKNIQTPSVGFVALGCPKNVVDSEVMLSRIGQRGYLIGADPDRADVVVINTCGFIEPAKQEALDAIRQAVKQKKKGLVGKIIVTGCLSQRMGERLLEEVPEIDALVGLENRDAIDDIISRVLADRDDSGHLFIASDHAAVHDDRGRLLINPSHWAYLRISEGCDRRCSFCTIPAIRGRFRSKPFELVISEAQQLVDNGAVELSLIAQDSNSYGRDLGIKNGLVQLIQELEKIESLRWIRLMYLYPAAVDDALIEAMAASEKVVHYVDIPIQHINNEILRQMRRTDTREHTTELIRKFRAALPDVVLRTTVITGFPGETQEQFDELLEFVRQTRFDALGAFPFSAEPDTRAAELPDQLPEDVKTARREAIMLAQQEIAFEKADAMKGRELTLLVDEVYEDGTALGRYYGQAPHIDTICVVQNCTAQAGQFIRARVVGREDYDLIVEQISD